MGDIQWGQCKYCKEDGPVRATYFRFPIVCNCCSPTHFERVQHCNNCEAVMPGGTEIWIDTGKLLDPVGKGLFKKVL